MNGTTIAWLVATTPPSGTQLGTQLSAAWDHHAPLIATLVAVGMIVKLGLIARLLIERRQRLRAQSVVEQQLAYVAHMSRVATMGQLAATLAHELRQPLAAIHYNAQAARLLMARPNSNWAEVGELVEAMAANNARATDVIDRVVALLRREERAAERVDLNEVCHGVRRLLQYAADMRRATVELSLDPELPPIMGDPVQLQQVVLNLMLNALEALSSRDGDRLVVVATSRREDAVELSVRDSGAGVSADAAARLFEPFFSTKEQGLGMGLVIVRSIVERHGGKIEATTHTSGGAIFRVVLPLCATDDASHRANSHVASSRTSSPSVDGTS